MSISVSLTLLFLAASASGQSLADDPQQSPLVQDELQRLRARVEALEQGAGKPPAPQGTAIDLAEDETQTVQAARADHILARPWYANIDLRGYAAFSYLDSGGTGAVDDGSFLIREASLFLDAQVWTHASVVVETWILRFPSTDVFNVGELYLKLDSLFAHDGGPGLGAKFGRIEVPFGEDYLRWDADETPLITYSAADPYGIDEGAELFGAFGGVHWIAAVTNGASGSGKDDGPAKLLAGKVYGEPFEDLYLSGSIMSMGSTTKSAFRFGGSAVVPVGIGASSTLGVSPSDDVDTTAWELDARIAQTRRASIALQFGQAYVNDDVSAFDRDLTWFEILPSYRLRDDLELVLRYSQIGTSDSDEGYIFNGKPMAQAESFGFDTHSLQRVSAGVCWTINPHFAAKLEGGHDWIDLIDVSPLDAENDERLFFGLELVASF